MSSNSSNGLLRGCLIAVGVLFLIGAALSLVMVVAVATIAASFEGSSAIAESDNYTTEFVSGNPKAANKIAVIDVKGEITSSIGFQAHIAWLSRH